MASTAISLSREVSQVDLTVLYADLPKTHPVIFQSFGMFDEAIPSSNRTRCNKPEKHGLELKELPKSMAKQLSSTQLPTKLVRLVRELPPLGVYEDMAGTHPRTVHHWGQRKLLLTEIEFLGAMVSMLKESGENPSEYTVVYAGAADGRHIRPMVQMMFPKVFKEFHLYDDVRRFHPTLVSASRDGRDGIVIAPFVHAHPRAGTHARKTLRRTDPYLPGWFTTEIAKEYAGIKTLFISDIRTNPTDDGVMSDNDAQMAWVRAMNPRATMLKFRLPFNKGSHFTYLDGEPVFQIWAPVSSTETRLWCHPPYDRTRLFTLEDYENRMFTFNRLYRPGCFEYKNVVAPTQCRCYDCIGELAILDRYLETAKLFIPTILFKDLTRWSENIANLSDDLSSRILGNAERLTKSMVFADHIMKHLKEYREKCADTRLPAYSKNIPSDASLPCKDRGDE